MMTLSVVIGVVHLPENTRIQWYLGVSVLQKLRHLTSVSTSAIPGMNRNITGWPRSVENTGPNYRIANTILLLVVLGGILAYFSCASRLNRSPGRQTYLLHQVLSTNSIRGFETSQVGLQLWVWYHVWGLNT